MIGDRIRFKQKRGTIRYVGPVVHDNTNRIWYGIEWDEPGNGIHDGSVVDESNGTVVRYFQTEPRNGSFVKPEKVEKAEDLKLCYEQRYLARQQVQELVTKDNSEKSHLAEGFLGLDGSNLGAFHPLHEELKLRENFNNITSLDISNTLFPSWFDLFKTVGRHFSNLRTLVAAENKIPIAPENASLVGSERELPQLTTLVLNSCDKRAVTAASRLLVWDSIEELRVAHCDLGVESLTHLPLKLKILDLAWNGIRLIDSNFLSLLPHSLTYLNLSKNSSQLKISGLSFEHKTLEKLVLDETSVNQLNEIEDLAEIFS